MTPVQEALARRLVACPAFRWMPGMRAAVGLMRLRLVVPLCAEEGVPNDHLPDLSDAATTGCLLALVREAWGDPGAHATPYNGETWWSCYLRVLPDDDGRCHHGRHDTEAEALIAALEAAP